MGRPDLPRPEFVISFVESADGYPTGRVTRVRYGDSGQIISQEELFNCLSTPQYCAIATGRRAYVMYRPERDIGRLRRR
jgi:hypothetical protein